MFEDFIRPVLLSSSFSAALDTEQAELIQGRGQGVGTGEYQHMPLSSPLSGLIRYHLSWGIFS